MKTREIEVKLYELDLKNIFTGPRREMTIYQPDKELVNGNKFKVLKATLIIEMPERKIEITESEFDKIIGEIDSTMSFLYVPTIGEHIKERIFKIKQPRE